MNETQNQLESLANCILEGNSEGARQSTYAAVAKAFTTGQILDVMLDAVNILVDLHEVGEYDRGRIGSAEDAINSSLQILEDSLARAEDKFNLNVSIGPIGLKAGNLSALVLSAAFRSIGFHAFSLTKTQTPLELLRNSEELKADLVVPLFSGDEGELQLRSFAEEIERGGFRTKFHVIGVARGFSGTAEVPFDVAKNPEEAMSRAAQWAVKSRSQSGA